MEDGGWRMDPYLAPDYTWLGEPCRQPPVDDLLQLLPVPGHSQGAGLLAAPAHQAHTLRRPGGLQLLGQYTPCGLQGACLQPGLLYKGTSAAPAGTLISPTLGLVRTAAGQPCVRPFSPSLAPQLDTAAALGPQGQQSLL